ncbi:LAMI_0G08900g1_1 [Lachancea mirantina]|uniref:Ubiquitin-like protein ATG12 n=1 Tax=Lachancea mirantina TaxID=1230905 RepID=A0A1G4KA46_9SACH|nr:LAMI_0G08900g1_1 [Lachancea mirantina]
MSRFLESEGSSTASSIDNSEDDNKSGTVQDRLNFLSRRLGQLGLEKDEDENVENPKSTTEWTEPRPDELRREEEAKETSTKPTEQRVKMPSDDKILIRFQAIGMIEQLNPNSAKITAKQPFSVVVTFLQKRLRVANVHCYVNNSFTPAPQQIVGDLWNMFKVQNELIISYCSSVAFG